MDPTKAPMYTVLEPENPLSLPELWRRLRGAYLEGGTRKDWCIAATDGIPGESFCNDKVLRKAEGIGFTVMLSRHRPMALYVDVDAAKDNISGIVAEAMQWGARLMKLPDHPGSPYYRWYLIEPPTALERLAGIGKNQERTEE